MNEWLSALPCDYLSNEIGRVYPGVSQGPPLQVREREWDDEPFSDIVLELEDIEGMVAESWGLKPQRTGTTLRLALKLPGARKLCCHLIEGLASTGDRVACRIQHMMRQTMEDLRENDDGDCAD